jgi:F-type H+-transporting ATPase subunit b
MNAGRDMAIADAKARIAAEKVEQDRALGMKMLFDAKRENVALQLEAAYREQLVRVFSWVFGVDLARRSLNVRWNLSMTEE